MTKTQNVRAKVNHDLIFQANILLSIKYRILKAVALVFFFLVITSVIWLYLTLLANIASPAACSSNFAKIVHLAFDGNRW